MKSMTRLATFLVLVSTAAAAEAQFSVSTSSSTAERRFQILGGGGYNAATRSFSEVTTFTQFVEEGLSTRDYDGSAGFVFEVGAIYSVTPTIGILGSFELFRGNNEGAFEEIVPHPLYFDQDRSVSGNVTDLTYNEQALHLDAVYSINRPSMTVDFFGGPTFFFTETEIIGDVATSSVYPFDDLELANTTSTQRTDNPIGFNVGSAFTYRFTPVVGVSVQARFSGAKVKIQRADGDPFEFDAGGFRIGAGIRLAF